MLAVAGEIKKKKEKKERVAARVAQCVNPVFSLDHFSSSLAAKINAGKLQEWMR